MSREIDDDLQAVAASGSLCPILLCSIETVSGTQRMWTGVGNLTWDDQTWYGVGTFLGVDNIEETTDTSATGATLSLSSIPSDFLQMIEGELAQNKKVCLSLGALDDAGGMVGTPVAVIIGTVDVPTTSDSGDTCTTSVTVENRLKDLDRARCRRYTDQDQQEEYEGDLGFAFVAALQDLDITWGQT